MAVGTAPAVHVAPPLPVGYTSKLAVTADTAALLYVYVPAIGEIAGSAPAAEVVVRRAQVVTVVPSPCSSVKLWSAEAVSEAREPVLKRMAPAAPTAVELGVKDTAGRACKHDGDKGAWGAHTFVNAPGRE